MKLPHTYNDLPSRINDTYNSKLGGSVCSHTTYHWRYADKQHHTSEQHRPGGHFCCSNSYLGVRHRHSFIRYHRTGGHFWRSHSVTT